MKILLCNKFIFNRGGAERYLLDLRDGLRERGHQVIDFAVRNANNLPSEYSDYFVRSPDLKHAFDSIYSFSAKRNITRLIKDSRPDIAHIHNIYHQISSSILHPLRRSGIPVVMTMHDYKFVCPNYSLFVNNSVCQKCIGGNYHNAVKYRCLKDSYLISLLAYLEMIFCKISKMYERNVDLFIAPSKFMFNKMIEAGISRKKLRYLPYIIRKPLNGYDFSKGEYILYMGSLTDKKGVDILIESAQNFRHIPIKIAGDGHKRNELKFQVKTMGLTNIEFLGHKSKEDLAGIIKNAFFLVVPSKWPEVSGLVVYEAFALGKCVVASRMGGIPELIDDEVNGLLFESGNVDDLSRKIRFLLDNPGKRKDFEKAAFDKFSKINDEKSHYQELISIYNELINDYK